MNNETTMLQRRLNLIGSYLSKYLDLNFSENYLKDTLPIINLHSQYYMISLWWDKKTSKFMTESCFGEKEFTLEDKNPFKVVIKTLEQLQMISNKVNGEITVKFLKNSQFLK